jgi:hypothetical protein
MEKYQTDAIMKQVWLHLVEDFQDVYGQEYALRPLKIFLSEGIKGLRAYNWPARGQIGAHLFKCDYQLESLFKRYRFKDDVYSDAEILAMSSTKFVDCQARISSGMPVDTLSFRVLRKARQICKRILGDYNIEEHMQLCRFGRRSDVTNNYRSSYLDTKLEGPITGTTEHVRWFEDYLLTDNLLREVLVKGENQYPSYQMCESSSITYVPKTYKAFRGVKKPTLIGSFYTYGLGKMLQRRLKKVRVYKGLRLDIRRLQETHKRLVKRSSRDRILATADLSAASDSISWELLNWLLPRKWLKVVLFGRQRQINVEGYGQIPLHSVCLMGDGHTFPLQTLVFYSLVKAMEELTSNGKHRLVSVYGDDLIYPSELHPFVRVVFPRLHLKLNEDKTYVTDYFRESCGADYCRGCDVRPFRPEAGSTELGGLELAQFLYKLINGLKLRWDDVEIPKTQEYLLQVLQKTQECVFQVPASFPDGAGIKTDRPRSGFFYSPVLWSPRLQAFEFRFVTQSPRRRLVLGSQSPYYWESLREASFPSEFDVPMDTRIVNYLVDEPVDSPMLQWMRAIKHPKYVYVKRGRRLIRMRRLVPFIARKSDLRVRVVTGSDSVWTEEPQG